ncbi:MAG: hypothetical protein GY839_14555 [candidate division Zixibacteria bacterium]|nr:hypothetical protein [candidate division Zixibacteria bacterium]
MNQEIKRAVELADELGIIFNGLVDETKDFDLKRLFKQLEADMMDIRHKMALAEKITDKSGK